jgi:hypothetical protein
MDSESKYHRREINMKANGSSHSNMGRALNNIIMGIFSLVTIEMAIRMDMESIFGLIRDILKEILLRARSKEKEDG